MHLTPIVSPEEWQRERDTLLIAEKEATRARDALAAQRRRLPLVPFDGAHPFIGPEGATTLRDLFAGRRQLIVYHFMFEPGERQPCAGCSLFADSLIDLRHLHARDTTLVLTSRAPQDELLAYRARMGWTIPWYTTTDEAFYAACGIDGGFGLSVFLRDGERVFRSYFTSGRGVESLGSVWSLLDLTPLGRQEDWEESPEGYPQSEPYTWWRRHDEYAR